MAIRVLLLTQWFDPEPTSKGLVFARELIRQGFEVEVVTGFPNYPGGRIYPGYRIQLLKREVIEGVQVTRVPLYPSPDRSAIGRVLNYLSFAASALVYGLFAAQRADVMYAYHPPLSVGIAAAIIRFFRRMPVVYDIQDMWPDTLRATGMVDSPCLLGMVGATCKWVYRRMDHLVVQSPGFRRLLMLRGVPGAKVDVICNWADEAALAAPQKIPPAAFPGAEKFCIVFAGNMGKAQALDTVLDAAALLQAKGSRACFVLMGAGVESQRLRQRAATQQLQNLVFLPQVPMAEVGGVLHAADALLVHLRRDPLFTITIPSKVQAYMAVGKPLLMAVDGDAAALLAKSGGGVRVPAEDAQALAEAVEALSALPPEQLHAMGRMANRYYRQHLSVSVGVARFATIFRRLASVGRHDEALS